MLGRKRGEKEYCNTRNTPQIQNPNTKSVFSVWSTARLHEAVSVVSYLLPRARFAGPHSRRDKVELVAVSERRMCENLSRYCTAKVAGLGCQGGQVVSQGIGEAGYEYV